MDTHAIQRRFLQLRSNRFFEFFVIFIIIFSALIVGAKTYEISARAMTLIRILDHLITFIFLAELLIRFLGEEQKRRFFRQGWNIFDTLIVVVSLVPIDNSEMAIVGRLIRVFRVLRMISIIPELRLLLNSFLKALPQLAYVLLLMFVIYYIYAAIGATLFESINPQLWGDISISLLTLFRVMTFEDWTDVMYETMTVYPLSWIYYLSFIFFTAFAFLNMVIGIVVNVLEQESARLRKEDPNEMSIEDLSKQLNELKLLIRQGQQGSPRG